MTTSHCAASVPQEPELDGSEPSPQALRTLQNYGPVLELARIQKERSLPDNDFARVVDLGFSGSSWGKIKAGTFDGNIPRAAAAVRKALTTAQTGKAPAEVRDGAVLFDHVLDFEAAVKLARASKDEHRLALLVGDKGSGKSVTLNYIHEQFPGSVYMHAHTSWGKSFLATLDDIARGIGMCTVMHSVRQAEHALLDELSKNPRLILIDEANHFGRDGINFLKSVLNETRCALGLGTLPNDLIRLNAEHNHETQQLIRRAVAIIQIPLVDSDQVYAMHAALFPGVVLNGHAPQIAQAANKFHRLDTVARIFNEVDPTEETSVVPAIERVERMIRVTPVR